MVNRTNRTSSSVRSGDNASVAGISAELPFIAGWIAVIARRAAGLIVLTVALPTCFAQVTVPATTNIFGAGHQVPPAPAGGGAGILPPVFALPAGCSRSVTFAVSGQVASNTPPSYGPLDGGTFGTNINSWGGIAGISMSAGFALVGVFCPDAEALDPAPPRLVFGNALGFATLSPLLNQVFFIGDGLTGSGTGNHQIFYAPQGATRLFVGFADGGSLRGDPGLYGDNHGELQVAATILTNTADFNNDGDTGTDLDIEAFFACLAGNCCAACGTADFNGDGDTGTDADIEAFFRVLAGGSC